MDAATRTNLLELRSKRKLAVRGHALLKRKQDVLIREFFEQVRAYRAYKADVHRMVRDAYRSLSFDIAYSGIFVSKSVSYATHSIFDVSIEERNLMGVRIPRIIASRTPDPVNAYESAPLLAQAAREFREVFERLVVLASMELAIHRLADEIKRTKRRVKNIEHIRIPDLEARARRVAFELDELERESFVRLKMVKGRIS